MATSQILQTEQDLLMMSSLFDDPKGANFWLLLFCSRIQYLTVYDFIELLRFIPFF